MLSIENWKKAHWSEIENNLSYPLYKGRKGKWAVLECRWDEQITSKDLKTSTITHLYRAVLDTETLELYHQDSNKLLLAKYLVQVLVRPLHSLIKTAYHLTLPISLPIETYKAVKEGLKEKKRFFEISWKVISCAVKNLFDIVRTPLYGIALETLSVLGTLLAAASPLAHSCCTEGLYWVRATAAKIELALNWQNQAHWIFCCVPGQQHKAGWIVAPCFQPVSLIMMLKHWNFQLEGTSYPYPDDALQVSLSNYARKFIKEERNQIRCSGSKP